MKTGITHFSDKSVLWFVAGAALITFVVGLFDAPTNGHGGEPMLLAASVPLGAFLGLLLWGATMPLFAWVSYYRTVRGFSLARSLLIVLGALLSVGLVVYAFAWATAGVKWVSLIIAAGTMTELFFAPWAIARERRYHASLNPIDLKAKRLKRE